MHCPPTAPFFAAGRRWPRPLGWLLVVAAAGACRPTVPARAAPAQAAPATAETALPRRLPTGHDQASLDATLLRHYRGWKARYLVTGPCGPDRTYVDSHQDSGQAGSITVSEAHGFGMLILAAMAPFDPDAHRLFDNMVRFMADHPSTAGSGLMAWDVHEGCQTPLEATSAADGDMDIALALLHAQAVWGHGGPHPYGDLARAHIQRLARHEAHAEHGYMGMWEDMAPGRDRAGSGRLSDLMMGHFRAFARACPDAGWDRMVDRGYALMAAVAAHSPVGLLPDFAVNLTSQPRPAPPRFLERDLDGGYGYNACRIPLRLGIDLLGSGDPRARQRLEPIVAHLAAASGGDPSRLRDGYRLTGEAVGASARLAFVAPLAVGAMVAEGQQAFFDRLYQHLRLAPMEADAYYGNTLRMLSLVAIAGRFGPPSGADAP